MKILVVDDDRRIVKTTCDILKIKGHEAIAAYTGEEGVDTVKRERPDCVLMDIKMPGISGVEAMKQMRSVIPDLPIVLVSAYATEDTVTEAERAGAYAVMSKPLDFQVILSFLSLLRKEESILVVDDDPGFCKTLKDILTLRGYRVETESEPQKVLDHLEKDYKLAVVLDLKLGAADGTDVLKEVRAKYPTKPVVLVTGYREEMANSIEKARRIGAYTCLYKPLEVDALLQMIEGIRLKKLQNLLASS
ncbi:MAG: response regulator [Gammaproteobacteria bacterium]|jgi:DNA-binding NtrC family response regulator|nr:response regulator [Gammaproteobacteria bacterium]MBU1409174.1 response regulator [Gammaproteobacteria bacterium]MBU1531070.1 response regulator [Gammaproteobacteria bacterium]